MTQVARLGTLTMVFRPSNRSAQVVAVMALERVAESRLRTLSMRIIMAPRRRILVMAFRHSSSDSRGGR